MNTKIAKKTRTAFTLLEILAVVVLMAIAMAVLATGVAPSMEASLFGDTRSMVLDMDARARVLATQGEPIQLIIRDNTIMIHSVGDEQTAAFATRTVPDSIAITIITNRSDTVPNSILFATDSTSLDYTIRINSESSLSQTLVSGLTGYAFDAIETWGDTP